jgi:hypothetical protein
MTKGDRAAVLPPRCRCGSLLGTRSLRVVSGVIVDPHRTPHPMTNTCTWSMKASRIRMRTYPGNVEPAASLERQYSVVKTREGYRQEDSDVHTLDSAGLEYVN